MERNMDLIRDLLFLVRNNKDDSVEIHSPDGVDVKDFVYHLKLLEQANFIEKDVTYMDDEPSWIRASLTWDGHEFIDAISNDTVWGKIKDKLKQESGNIPISVIKALGIKLVEQHVLQ